MSGGVCGACNCLTWMAAATEFMRGTGSTGRCRISRKSRPSQDSTVAAFSPGDNMTAHGIENGQEYREAPRTVSMLVGGDPAPGSPHGDRLVALMRLIA